MIEKGVNQKEIVTVASGMWETWKKGRQDKEKVWDEVIKNYLIYIDEGKYKNWEWRCKKSRPVTQEIIDTVSSSVKSALFPDNEEFFRVEGLDEIGKEFEAIVENYMKTVLFKMRYTTAVEPFIKQTCILGNSSAGIYWRNEEVTRRRWQDGVVVPERQIVWDSSRIETHDMFNVVFDPRVPFYSQNVTRIRRHVIHIDELKAKKDIYQNLKHVKGGEVPSEQSDSDRITRRSLYGINEGVVDKSNDIELLILNGDINIKGKIYRDYVCVIANRSTLLRFEENPYWCGNPHIFASYSEFHNEMLGRGPAEPITGLQSLIDTFSCQKADLASVIIGGFWAYQDDGVIDPNDLVSRPFGMVQCENVNNIKSLVPTANPTLAFSEIQDLRAEAERSSGASAFRQGVVMPGRRSATEALQIGSGSDNRFNDIVQHIGDMAIEPSLNMILQQEFQYNYGSQAMPAPAWEGMYKVVFHGARTSSVRSLALQQMQQFMQAIGSSDVFAQFINPPEIIKEWQKLLSIKNKKLTRTEPLSNEFPGIGGAQPQQPQEMMPGEGGGGFG